MSEKDYEKILEQLKVHEKRIRLLEVKNQSLVKKVVDSDASEDDGNKLVLPIVNKIGDCKESSEIQDKVLDQKSMEAKILLCFYLSFKYFKNAWLTTGDIEKITSELGVKITMGNITNKIKNNIKKYLESGTTRKKGQSTPYRINRAGVKRFEKIILSTK